MVNLHCKQKGHACKRFISRYFGRSAGDRTFHIINYALFLLLGAVMLYPFIHVVVESLENVQLVDGVSKKMYNFAAYKAVLSNVEIVRAFFNTVFVMIAHVAFSLVCTFLGAYPLSKKHFMGRNALLIMLMITMLFSGGLIPTYILYTQVLKWQNNFLVYIIPGAVGAYNVIVVKSFLQGIPESLEEAAKIDGANDFLILIRIYVPLSLPIVATVGLWVGVGTWNNYMTGVLYISDNKMRIMQNILRDMLILSSSTDGAGGDSAMMALADNVKMATVVVGIIPVLVVYPFVQKYFVKGVLTGSVKG